MGTRLTPEQKRERDRARRTAKMQEELDKANIRAARPRTRPPDPDEPIAWIVLQTAREIGREADLYYRAHVARYSHKPSKWTAEQKIELLAFLKTFIRPDGTPQPVPHRKNKRQ